MKRIFWIPFVIVLAIGLIFSTLIYPRLTILSGYAAQSVCACSFIADRPINLIESQDNSFSQLFLTESKVDRDKKTVTSSVFGLQAATAHYVPGRGCFLSKKGNSSLEAIDLVTDDTLSTNKYWPYGALEKDSTFQSIDLSKINSAVEGLFDQDDAFIKKTRAVLVVYKDHIIAERYSEGISEETPLLGWSMTKSMINTFIGILVKKGKLRLDDPAPIPEWQNDKRSKITIRHLLQMNSGLEWLEDYGSVSDATNMLFNSEDMFAMVTQKPLEFEPESNWKYSSGTSNLLSGIIRKVLNNDSIYSRFPETELFDKLGMNSAIIQTDASGNFVGSSYGFATARDWAKFGLLYLHEGIWNGEHILPEGWVDFTSQSAPNSNGIYGAHFWLNHDGIEFKDAPYDMIAAHGFQGQRVFVLPEQEMVVVRLGLAGDDVVDFNQFLKEIVNSIKK